MSIIVTTGGPITTGLTPKSILEIIQEVCPVIGLTVPTGVFSSSDREHVELQALANSKAKEIALDYDWEELKEICTYTGDGTTEGFDLPDDYERMLIDGDIWQSSLQTPLQHILSSDDWLGLEVQNFTLAINAWHKYGGQIHIKPVLGTGVTAEYFYISNLIASDTAGQAKTDFTDDSDRFRLDGELLKLGIIWQWKANKGFPYAEDMTNYENRKGVLVSKDKGSRILIAGKRRAPYGVGYPWPGVLGP